MARDAVAGLQVCSLRRAPQPALEAKRASRVSDGALVLVKAGLLCLGAAVLLASRLGPGVIPRVVRNEARGVSMLCPRGWSGREWTYGVLAFRHDRTVQAAVSVWRMSWAEFAVGRGEAGPRPSDQASRGDLAQAMADVCSCLGFRAATGGSPAEAITLGSRQALMLAATGHGGDCQEALVVAAGEDLLFVQLRASSEAALRALRPQWRALIQSVRATAPALSLERAQEGPAAEPHQSP